jgi:outer membrane protein assembly factor BamA
MWFRKCFIPFIVLILISEFASAQQDTVKTDSTHLYKDIESYSKRSKFTGFIYRLIFKPVASDPKNKEVKKKVYKKLIQKPYSAFEGKIIRNIDVVTLDPFGYSASDTTVGKQNFLSRAGNRIHIKTQGITIRNLLLIHKNQPFNSLLVKESERLIRNQTYVHEVSFSVVAAGVKSIKISCS